MRARYNYSYNYSYGKENGDFPSGKQCFEEGKRMHYRTQAKGKECAKTKGRMYTRRKEDANKEEREYAHSITRKKLRTKLLFQQAATTYYNYNYS